MHYEEQVINGVLCWRSTPYGEWTAYTPEQLTNEVMDLRGCCRAYEKRMEKARLALTGDA